MYNINKQVTHDIDKTVILIISRWYSQIELFTILLGYCIIIFYFILTTK